MGKNNVICHYNCKIWVIPAQGQANAGKIVFQVGANAGDTLNLQWSQAFSMSGIYSQVFKQAAIADKGIAKKKVDGQAEQFVWQVSTAENATKTLANIDTITDHGVCRWCFA